MFHYSLIWGLCAVPRSSSLLSSVRHTSGLAMSLELQLERIWRLRLIWVLLVLIPVAIIEPSVFSNSPWPLNSSRRELVDVWSCCVVATGSPNLAWTLGVANAPWPLSSSRRLIVSFFPCWIWVETFLFDDKTCTQASRTPVWVPRSSSLPSSIKHFSQGHPMHLRSSRSKFKTAIFRVWLDLVPIAFFFLFCILQLHHGPWTPAGDLLAFWLRATSSTWFLTNKQRLELCSAICLFFVFT